MNRKPTFKQLKYLCAVAKHLHFGQAAKNCHISQSTLSAGIQELEENLGVIVFERSNKKILLTPIGKQIHHRSQQILNSIDDLTALAQASQQPFTGEMRIGVIPTIAPYLLPKLLGKIRSRYPDFKLYIREDLSGHLVREL